VIDPPRRARANQARIDALWDFDRADQSEIRFRDAAASARGQLRDVLLTQVARAVGLQARYDEALAILDRLPDTDDDLAGAELRARTQLERGRVLNSSGEPAAARPYFAAAHEVAAAAGLEHLGVDALHMLAIVAATGEQDELNLRAFDLADRAADPRARAWRPSLLNNMGWSAFERADYDLALERFEAALAGRREQGNEHQVRIARWCIARTLRELGRVNEALDIQLALSAEHQAAGTADPYVDEEIIALRAQASVMSRPRP
jgi:tetratricopeptide (TPR) repeat protein